MKLSTKLSLAMGLLVVFLGGVGGFSLFELNAFSEQTFSIINGWMPRAIESCNLKAVMGDFRLQQIQHIVAETVQAANTREANLERDKNQFEEIARDLQKSLSTEEGKKLYDELKATWYPYMESSRKVRALATQGSRDEALRLANGSVQKEYDAVNTVLTKMVEFQDKGARAAGAETDAIAASARTMILAVMGGAVLVAILLTITIIRNTMNQLGKDPGELEILSREVADGKLDIAKDDKAVGVYAEILTMVESLEGHIENARRESENAKAESARAHEAMLKADAASKDAQGKRESMLAAADRLEEVANIVSSASTELAAQIEQSDRGAAEQAARVSETATAMNEMNTTVVEVARNAGNAAEVSAATRDKAENGASIVREAVNGIHQVQEVSLALKEDMAKLSENAQAISQIMAVISDIADQTNLLALNAAIEAARAGEAGRGFAVVADSVRQLAEKTMSSTTDVGKAIKAIQDSAVKSMGQVDNAVALIEQATQLSARSGEALEEIVSMVDNSADQVRAIAAASEQQSASSEEINRSIEQVNSISSETAQAMREAAKAVSDLAGQAQVLSNLIEDMKRA